MKVQILTASIVSTFFLLPSAFGQGALTPPGPPAPTMKSLDQIEPRTPISTVPFTISQPGSYYFTTNVNAVGLLTVNADNVTIDLNGFTFTGPGGSGSGVFMSAVHSNLCVRNGTIAGRSGVAISCSTAVNSQLVDLRILGNGAGGVLIGEGSLIEHCEMRNNGGVGLTTGDRCVIRECTFTANTSSGLSVGNSVLVQDSASDGNSSAGVTSGMGCHLSRCTFSGNSFRGANLSQDCILKDCVILQNQSDGVVGGKGATIIDCNVVSNSGAGLNLFENCTVDHCTIIANGAAGIDGFPANTVNNCLVMFNGGIGIFVTDGSTVMNCTVRTNQSEGIEVSSQCLVTGNNCSFNGLPSGTAGIHATGTDNRIDSNHSNNNGYGFLVDTSNGGNVIVRNTYIDNVAGFSVAPGNKVGPLVTDPSSASANAWANIGF